MNDEEIETFRREFRRAVENDLEVLWVPGDGQCRLVVAIGTRSDEPSPRAIFGGSGHVSPAALHTCNLRDFVVARRLKGGL